MLCTKKEIENMKKIGELNHECININKEKIYKLSGMLEERDNHFEEKYEKQQRSILHLESILKNMEGNKTQMKNINQAYIHKHKTHRNGIAMIKNQEGKYTRITLISVRKFNRRLRRNEYQYKINSVRDGVEDFKNFYSRNQHLTIHGALNITNASREHKRLLAQSMTEYRIRVGLIKAAEKMEVDI